MSTLTATRKGDQVVVEHSYPAGRRVWAVLRIAFGWLFLWAFFDRLLALGFPTGRDDAGSIDHFGEAAFVRGGSPTEAFLADATQGPFAEAFDAIAGAAWADWIVMIALLAIGVGLLLGIGMRLAAGGGALLLVLAWAATSIWPEQNPFLNGYLISAIALIGLSWCEAGDTFGLGRRWSHSALVQRFPGLK